MDAEQQFVIFQLATDHYALPASMVQEIISLPKLTPLAHPRSNIGAVAMVGGTTTPVLDLRARLRFLPVPPTEATRMVVVRRGNTALGIIVDSVLSKPILCWCRVKGSHRMGLISVRIDDVATIPAHAVAPMSTDVRNDGAHRPAWGSILLAGRTVFMLDLALAVPQHDVETCAALQAA